MIPGFAVNGKLDGMKDPRCYPLIDLDLCQIREMLLPVLCGAEPREVLRVEGGFVNTVYRVTLDRADTIYGLRVYAAGRTAFEVERRILSGLRTALPVPALLFADASEQHCAYPYTVYRWRDGITLNECRRRMPPAALLSLAGPLGRLLATVASFSFADIVKAEPTANDHQLSKVEALLSINDERLLRGPARTRLGGTLSRKLRRQLDAKAAVLSALDPAPRLVHGDLGGRNILVAPDDNDGWRITGLIDWEDAFQGSPLWDVGSLFRYAKRYSQSFRQRFERGYGEAGGVLPEDWWRISRLLDAIRQVETLDEERVLPIVFAECCELIEAVVAEWA
jgi:aminoglycoside phosphotransferase (APT) family kinase protein